MKRGLFCLIALSCLAAAPARAQIAPQPGGAPLAIPTDPLCQPLRDCARGVLPQVDDMTSSPDAVSAKIAPYCDAQMVSCNDAIAAQTQQQIANGGKKNAQSQEAAINTPESRARIEKLLTPTVLNGEVDLYRYQKTGQVPTITRPATPAHARVRPSAASPYQ